MAERRLRGRLRDGATAPQLGEDVERLLELPGVVVEQILSGTLESRVDYRQEHDEWVLLLAGHAALVEHTLVTTAPGSSWLAVHITR